MQLDNVQFDKPIDSADYFESFEQWVSTGIAEFLQMMQLSEPKEIAEYNTSDAQIGALRECAKFIDEGTDNTSANSNPLLAWYLHALMTFIGTTFAKVPARLLPSTSEDTHQSVVEKSNKEYIKNAMIKILSQHRGANYIDELDTNIS